MKTFGSKKSKSRYFQGPAFGEQENLFPIVQNSIQDLETLRKNKKRNPDNEFHLKNSRQRISPPKAINHSTSSSIGNNLFHQSKLKSRVRGKKFYIDCLSNARREDVAYLNQLLSSNLHGVNFNVFITCPDWMENQLQFYELIEQLGFVRDTKPEMFFFRNLDPEDLLFAIKNVLDQSKLPFPPHEPREESEDESASPRSLVTLKSVDEFSRRSINPSPLADNLLSYWDKFTLGSMSPHAHQTAIHHEETPLFHRSNFFEEKDTGLKDSRFLHPISPVSDPPLHVAKSHNIIPRPERKSISSQKPFSYFKHMHSVESTPALSVYQTDNFITPQGKICFMHKWLDSKPADPNCISFLREKLQINIEDSSVLIHPFSESIPIFPEPADVFTHPSNLAFKSNLCVINDLQAYQSSLSCALLNDDCPVELSSASDSLFDEEVRHGYGSSFVYHSPTRDGSFYEAKKKLKFSKARRLSKLMKTPESHRSLNYVSFAHCQKLVDLFEFRYSPLFLTILDFLEVKESFQLANKKLYLCVLSYFITKNGLSNVLDLKGFITWKKFNLFIKEYSRGCLIGEGACKRVYRLFSSTSEPSTALSIMDIDDLEDRGMEIAISKELLISILCSSLVVLNICPNLVKVYGSFKYDADPSNILWQRADTFISSDRALNRKFFSQGRYQYIHMEFCNEGDLETYVRKVGVLSVHLVRLLLFQMFFSMYSCRVLYRLRHFDIKLLNFFLHLDPYSGKSTCIQIEETKFYLNPIGDCFYLLKLGDFGTAVFDTPLDSFVTVQQFCTLENSAPEFLLLGSLAKQGFAADTFCLGLCMLHLLTGYEPYEELMKDIICPKSLSSVLVNIWKKDPVIMEVIQSLIDPNEKSSFITYGAILADTLYRYLVLLGDLPTFREDFIENYEYEKSGVRNAVVDLLGLGSSSKSVAHRSRSSCTGQYLRDKKIWSFHQGNNDIIAQARQRLCDLGVDAFSLFEKLLCWNPHKRCTLYDALASPVFQEVKSMGNFSISSVFSYFAKRGIPKV